MDETKTVSSDSMDLYLNQCRDVSNMRASLLSFNKNDPNSAKRALQNITVLRVYHQISRIIRYTEMMDKIEDKMYESIDLDLNSMDTLDPMTWKTLLNLQSRLQQNMIESHKILEPYLDLSKLTTVEITAEANDPADSFTSMILDQESREKLRTSAQQVLAAINTSSTIDATEVEEVEENPEDGHQMTLDEVFGVQEESSDSESANEFQESEEIVTPASANELAQQALIALQSGGTVDGVS